MSLPPPQLIQVAAAAGYDYVSLRVIPVTAAEHPYHLDREPQMLRETVAALSATGLKALDIELFRLAPDIVVADFIPVLEVGAKLGARHVIAGAVDGDIPRLAEHFAQLCELAAPFGLTVDLEPVTFFPIPDIAHGSEVVAKAGQPNGGLLIDTLHFSRSHDRPEALAALPRNWFHFAQLSHAPAKGTVTREQLIFTARAARDYLGHGDLDVRGIVASLPAIPYSLENPNDAAVAAYGIETHIHRTLPAAKRYLGDNPFRVPTA